MPNPRSEPATPSPEPGPEPASRPELTYEAARDELVDVVRQLEQGGTTLEGSLALWERGEELVRICQAWLDGAQGRLDAALQRRGDGADPDART